MRVLIFALFELLAVLAWSQTSEEEYTYITVGYHQQITHGLSPREGYSFEHLQNKVTVTYDATHTMDVLGLYSTEDNEKRLVAIMLHYQKISTSNAVVNENYFCIPHPKSSQLLFNKAAQDVLAIEDKELLKTYNFALYSLTSQSYFQTNPN